MDSLIKYLSLVSICISFNCEAMSENQPLFSKAVKKSCFSKAEVIQNFHVKRSFLQPNKTSYLVNTY